MSESLKLKKEGRIYAFQRRYWAERTNARPYDHRIVNYFSSQRVDFLQSIIDFSEVRSALEVGAGDGFATYPMEKVLPRVFASDLSLLMLESNPAREGAKIQASAERLPFASESVDLVYCWEVLHHVSNVESAVAEMRRVSRKYVIFFEPNRNNPAQFLFSLLKKSERGGLKFSKNYLRRVCGAVGLEILSLQTVGCILPNMTPAWLFPFLRRLAFVRPLTGISHVVVARR